MAVRDVAALAHNFARGAHNRVALWIAVRGSGRQGCRSLARGQAATRVITYALIVSDTESGQGHRTRNVVLPEVGQRFGRGVIVDPDVRLHRSRQTRRGAILRCDCGVTYEAQLRYLSNGQVRSCGCLQRDSAADQFEQVRQLGIEAGRKHDMCSHPLYGTWNGMMARCYNTKVPAYRIYGGQGVLVCDEWHDVAAFIAWIEANLGQRSAGMTLDRYPNNSGNYEPGNVRWATKSEQALNRRVA